MKTTKNQPKDLKFYDFVFDLYKHVVIELCNQNNVKLESIKHEKEIFRPDNRGGAMKTSEKYLNMFDRSTLDPYKKIEGNIDGFQFSFPLHRIIDFKYFIEVYPSLVTPKHHKFAFTELKQKQVA